MSDFEVCPVGTQARIEAVEAELRSMHRCFGVTELARDKYQAERDALLDALRYIAAIAHEGGLRGIDPSKATCIVRKLTLPFFDGGGALDDARTRVDAAIAKAEGGSNGC